MRVKKPLPSSAEDFELVPIPGTDLYVQARTTMEVRDDAKLDVDFVAVFEVVDGRLELDELTAKRRPGGPPVTTTSLRKLNTKTLHDFGLTAFRRVDENRYQPVDWTREPEEDELDYVVRLYRMCAATGEDGNEMIARQLGVSSSTAHQKVWLARKVGLLEPVQTRDS